MVETVSSVGDVLEGPGGVGLRRDVELSLEPSDRRGAGRESESRGRECFACLMGLRA